MHPKKDEYKKFGIEVFSQDSLIDSNKPLLSVGVDVFSPTDPGLSKIRFAWKARRGNFFHLHHFEHKDSKVLSFFISTEVHDSFLRTYSKLSDAPPTAMTYYDFCFMHSDGTTPESLFEVPTPLRENAKLGDLTWLLPSKFADDLVDLLYFANQSVFEGILQNAILLGPMFHERGNYA